MHPWGYSVFVPHAAVFRRRIHPSSSQELNDARSFDVTCSELQVSSANVAENVDVDGRRKSDTITNNVEGIAETEQEEQGP